jgi:hypothetical protein
MERIKERRKIVSKCNVQMERIKERRKIVSITLKQKCVRHKFSASSLLEKLFAHRQEIYF